MFTVGHAGRLTSSACFRGNCDLITGSSLPFKAFIGRAHLPRTSMPGLTQFKRSRTKANPNPNPNLLTLTLTGPGDLWFCLCQSPLCCAVIPAPWRRRRRPFPCVSVFVLPNKTTCVKHTYMSSSHFPYNFTLQIPQQSISTANLLKDVLEVDAELRPALIQRNIEVVVGDGGNSKVEGDSTGLKEVEGGDGAKEVFLKASFRSSDLRSLRASVGSFLEHAKLCAATVERFQ